MLISSPQQAQFIPTTPQHASFRSSNHFAYKRGQSVLSNAPGSFHSCCTEQELVSTSLLPVVAVWTNRKRFPIHLWSALFVKHKFSMLDNSPVFIQSAGSCVPRREHSSPPCVSFALSTGVVAFPKLGKSLLRHTPTFGFETCGPR